MLAGPLVRSSYRAGRLYQQASARRQQTRTAHVALSRASVSLATMAKSRNAEANKAARAEAKAARKAAAKERRSSALAGVQHSAQEDKRLLPYMIGAFVLIVGVSVAVGVWAGGFTMITMIPLGVVLGVLVAFIIFGRRAQRSVYSKAEGQTGAAAWALDNLRGKWRVTPGVAATGHFDAVHRVIGRPGVILVGEGSPARVKPLLAQEKKRTARLVGDIPIYDIIVGNGEGEVPLAKLERHLTRLPANITVKQMDSLESRLAALGSRAGAAAMPKGPMPGTAQDARRAAHRARGDSRAASQRRTTAVPVSAVLQPAAVEVGEQRGYDQRDQQPAHRRPAQPDVQSLVDRDHLQAQRQLARGEPNSRTATPPSTNQITSTAVDSMLAAIQPERHAESARP